MRAVQTCQNLFLVQVREVLDHVDAVVTDTRALVVEVQATIDALALAEAEEHELAYVTLRLEQSRAN